MTDATINISRKALSHGKFSPKRGQLNVLDMRLLLADMHYQRGGQTCGVSIHINQNPKIETKSQLLETNLGTESGITAFHLHLPIPRTFSQRCRSSDTQGFAHCQQHQHLHRMAYFTASW